MNISVVLNTKPNKYKAGKVSTFKYSSYHKHTKRAISNKGAATVKYAGFAHCGPTTDETPAGREV